MGGVEGIRHNNPEEKISDADHCVRKILSQLKGEHLITCRVMKVSLLPHLHIPKPGIFNC